MAQKGSLGDQERTLATLLILPAIFAMLAWRHGQASASLDPEDPQSQYFEPHAPGNDH